MGLLQGIWWGMIFAVLVQAATLTILTARTNWDAEVTKIKRILNVTELACYMQSEAIYYAIVG